MKKKTKKTSKILISQRDLEKFRKDMTEAAYEFQKQLDLHKQLLYEQQVAIMLKEMVQEQFNKELKDIIDG